MLGRIAQALDDYSTAIKLQPTPDAYYGRGLTYRHEFRDKDGEAPTTDTLVPTRLAPRFSPGTIGFRTPYRILKWC
jgi:hypothetical protein